MTGLGWSDVLRYFVAGLAAVTSGSLLIVFVLYLRAWFRAPVGARLRPRHVSMVALGTLGLVAGVGIGVYDQIGMGFNPRLVVYVVSLLLILSAVVEIGRLQRGGRSRHRKGK